MSISEFEPVVFAPFLHDLNEVLNLWVVSVLEHLNDLDQSLFRLFSRDHHLENSDRRTSLSFPELRVWVESLKHVKCLD